MRGQRIGHRKAASSGIGAGLLVLSIWQGVGLGDEPGRFGRLFRFGGGNNSASAGAKPPEGMSDLPPLPSAPARVVGGSTPIPVADAGAGPIAAQPRILPQPRMSRAVTDADPIVTRVTLGRSDNGAQFGMFLQVFADGTVIDSEGVHRLGRDGIKGVMNVLESSDVYRVRGHCGAPSTDFIEFVQMVVYERNLGRLRANSFSFSGNSQGCDAAVRNLQAALDALQMKLARTANPVPAEMGMATTTTTPAPVIGLTPVSAETSTTRR